MPITKEEFLAYEDVRRSGKTNMYDVVVVSRLSDLPRRVVLAIMKNYSALEAKYIQGKEGEEEI